MTKAYRKASLKINIILITKQHVIEKIIYYSTFSVNNGKSYNCQKNNNLTR